MKFGGSRRFEGRPHGVKLSSTQTALGIAIVVAMPPLWLASSFSMRISVCCTVNPPSRKVVENAIVIGPNLGFPIERRNSRGTCTDGVI